MSFIGSNLRAANRTLRRRPPTFDSNQCSTRRHRATKSTQSGVCSPAKSTHSTRSTSACLLTVRRSSRTWPRLFTAPIVPVRNSGKVGVIRPGCQGMHSGPDRFSGLLPLPSLAPEQSRSPNRHDLVVVALQDESRHIELLEVFREVRRRERRCAPRCPTLKDQVIEELLGFFKCSAQVAA